jgi:hypothetical protein
VSFIARAWTGGRPLFILSVGFNAKQILVDKRTGENCINLGTVSLLITLTPFAYCKLLFAVWAQIKKYNVMRKKDKRCNIRFIADGSLFVEKYLDYH